MTIPADRITFDGDTAWWVRELEPVSIAGVPLDRPCDWCNATECTCDDGPDEGCQNMRIHQWPCRLRCIEGRHTWEIEVEVPMMDWIGQGGLVNDILAYADGRSPSANRRTLRVSVVPGMVLPISLVEPALPCVTMEGFVIPEGERIALPPVAAAGMWAVQLRWEEA